MKGENKLIEEITRNNALFVSAAVQNKHIQLTPIFSWFRSLQPINLPTITPQVSSSWFSGTALDRWLEKGVAEARQPALFENPTSDESLIERFRSLLTNADAGIIDLKVDKSESDEFARRARSRRILLKHQSEFGDAWLPLEEESKGTQTLFRIAMPILHAIQEGSTILVDELEASLHPMLAQRLVRQFNTPETNPRNAQLIFTTHDINLLGTTLHEPALRRDQVWLTEKNDEGATELYPLTDYKPRKAENLERGYLQGRYGAIPFLGDFTIAGK